MWFFGPLQVAATEQDSLSKDGLRAGSTDRVLISTASKQSPKEAKNLMDGRLIGSRQAYAIDLGLRPYRSSHLTTLTRGLCVR